MGTLRLCSASGKQVLRQGAAALLGLCSSPPATMHARSSARDFFCAADRAAASRRAAHQGTLFACLAAVLPSHAFVPPPPPSV